MHAHHGKELGLMISATRIFPTCSQLGPIMRYIRQSLYGNVWQRRPGVWMIERTDAAKCSGKAETHLRREVPEGSAAFRTRPAAFHTSRCCRRDSRVVGREHTSASQIHSPAPRMARRGCMPIARMGALTVRAGPRLYGRSERFCERGGRTCF